MLENFRFKYASCKIISLQKTIISRNLSTAFTKRLFTPKSMHLAAVESFSQACFTNI